MPPKCNACGQHHSSKISCHEYRLRNKGVFTEPKCSAAELMQDNQIPTGAKSDENLAPAAPQVATSAETRPPQHEHPEACPVCDSPYCEHDEAEQNLIKKAWESGYATRAAAPVEPPKEGCSQSERDKQILDAIDNPAIIYYGPHLCDLCGTRMICKTGNDYQPTLRFDYPGEIVYPDHNWTVHRCPPKPICVCATSKICPIHSSRVPAPERVEPAQRPFCMWCGKKNCTEAHKFPSGPASGPKYLSCCGAPFNSMRPCKCAAASSPAAPPQQKEQCTNAINQYRCQLKKGHAGRCEDHRSASEIARSVGAEPAARVEQPTPRYCPPTCYEGLHPGQLCLKPPPAPAVPVAVAQRPNIQRLVNLLNDYQIEAQNVDETLVKDCTEVLEKLAEAHRSEGGAE